MRCFAIVLSAFIALAAAPAYAACDLTPLIGAPPSARAGAGIRTTLEIANRGDTSCPGTAEIASGYMVDIFLSTDRTPPPSWAVYNASWREDVLLRGGRVSNTQSVAGGASFRYGAPRYEIGPFLIPADTPTGDYFVCAGVDMGARVAESNERNNVACNPIRIVAPLRIDPRRGPTPAPTPSTPSTPTPNTPQ